MEWTKRRATSSLQMYWHRNGARPSATTILTHIWINCRMKRSATCVSQNKLWTHWGRVPHISHYLNRCWDIVNWTLRSKLERNLDRNSYIFYQQKCVFENVVSEMAAILSREGWVKQTVSVLLANCSTHISACYPLVLVAFAGLLFIKACMRHMMTSSNGNFFRVTGPLWRESTGHRWIPLTKARDAECWCFFWSALEQTVEQATETPVIWDAIASTMTWL